MNLVDMAEDGYQRWAGVSNIMNLQVPKKKMEGIIYPDDHSLSSEEGLHSVVLVSEGMATFCYIS
jgi:hypothetical protein